MVSDVAMHVVSDVSSVLELHGAQCAFCDAMVLTFGAL